MPGRSLVLCLVLNFVAAMVGAAVGPEFAISQPNAAEAPFDQIQPRIATNGTDFLAVWLDSRESHEPVFRHALYASRIDSQGHLVDPFGVRWADDVYHAAVASNGHGYVVAYSTYGGDTWTRRFGNDGQPVQAPVYVSKTFIDSLASNGDGYLALTSDAAGTLFSAVFLDAEGVPHGGIDLDSMREPALVAAGRDYRVIDQKWSCDGVHACEVSARFTTIDSSSRQVTQKAIAGVEVGQWSRTNAIASNDRIAVASISDGAPGSGVPTRHVTFQLLDFSGDAIGEPHLLASQPSPCYCGEYRASLAWDGSQFLVAWPQPLDPATYSPSALVGVRVTKSGEIVDSQPLAVTNPSATYFVSSHAEGAMVLLTPQQRFAYAPYYYSPADIVVRSSRDLTDFAAGRVADQVVQSAAIQSEPAVASAGSTVFVAWRELDQPSAIRAATIDLRSPVPASGVTLSPRGDVVQTGVSVAALRDFALVVWRQERGDELRILGLRIGYDGAPLDATPHLIATMHGEVSKHGSTSVATDGTQFFVVWDTDRSVFGARVTADGVAIDDSPIEVLRDPGFAYHVTVTPRVVWSVGMFVVVWGEYIESNLLISPPPPPHQTIRTARVTAAGSVLDATDSPRLIDKIGPVASPSIAINDGVIMVVWAAGDDTSSDALTSCLHALPLDAQGRPLLASDRQLDCTSISNVYPMPLEPAVVAKDNGFLLLWSRAASRDVAGRFLTTTASGGESIVISPPRREAWNAVATETAGGTFVVYGRLADDALSGGVGRLFARVLDQIATPKRRAARR